MDYAGSLTNLQEQDVFAPYKPLAKAGRVTLDAVAVARNYADALSASELQTLNQLFIFQDLHIINSQNWALGTPTAPLTLTAVAASGSIAANAVVYVGVSARSGANYFIGGGNSPALVNHLTVGALTTGYAVTASIAAVEGAVAYDWYVGTSATQYYYTTTTIASATITSVPTVAQALPDHAAPVVDHGGSVDGSYRRHELQRLQLVQRPDRLHPRAVRHHGPGDPRHWWGD